MDASLKTEYPFLGDSIELSMDDRHDPTVIKVLVDIETWELEKGRGLEYLERLENAGFMICSDEVNQKIKTILINRHKHERK